MFALIETNGATHIAIHIPADGADKSLPALARMLEKNSIFIAKGWHELRPVQPRMSITLGDKIEIEGDVETIIVCESDCVLDDSFVAASPEVFTSNAAFIKKRDEEISRLRTELNHVKNELNAAREMISTMSIADSD